MTERSVFKLNSGSPNCALSSVLVLEVKGQCQNMSSSIKLTEPTDTHYHVKLNQNITDSLQVEDNFLVEKYDEIAFKIKDRGQT